MTVTTEAKVGVGRSLQTLIVLVVTLLYAVCYVAIKAGLPFAPPLLFGGLRGLIAGAALLALAAALGQPAALPRRTWPAVLLLALLATTVTYGGMFLSPGRTGAGIASVLGQLQPLVVVVLAAPFLGEAMTRAKMAALGLGLLGVLLISVPELVGPGAYGVSGAALALAASFGAGAGSVIVKRLGNSVHLLPLAGWQLVVGSLPLFVCARLAEHSSIIWSGQFVALLFFLALAGTSLTTAAWYWLVRQQSDVGRLSMFLFLIPVIGVALAFFVFGERLSPPEMAGVGLAVASIGLVLRGAPGHH